MNLLLLNKNIKYFSFIPVSANIFFPEKPDYGFKSNHQISNSGRYQEVKLS